MEIIQVEHLVRMNDVYLFIVITTPITLILGLAIGFFVGRVYPYKENK